MELTEYDRTHGFNKAIFISKVESKEWLKMIKSDLMFTRFKNYLSLITHVQKQCNNVII